MHQLTCYVEDDFLLDVQQPGLTKETVHQLGLWRTQFVLTALHLHQASQDWNHAHQASVHKYLHNNSSICTRLKAHPEQGVQNTL